MREKLLAGLIMMIAGAACNLPITPAPPVQPPPAEATEAEVDSAPASDALPTATAFPTTDPNAGRGGDMRDTLTATVLETVVQPDPPTAESPVVVLRIGEYEGGEDQVLVTQDTVVEWEDGSPATWQDITADMRITADGRAGFWADHITIHAAP